MPWPQSHDFQDAVLNPKLSFADPDLRDAEVAKDAKGLPIPASGQFGIVYQMVAADGRRWALKCFTADIPGRSERYKKISAHLRRCDLPFMVGFEYLDEGVFIQGAWYPVLKMDWVEGQTLNRFVGDWLDQPSPIKVLIEMWPKVAQRLREKEVTHADLQHGNVMLVPGKAKGSVSLKLVDYDGMYLPELAGTQSGESGHPCYQHPRRLSEGIYTGEVDRFSHLVIYTALRALLVKGRTLWQSYNYGDNLVFSQADFQKPRESRVLRELWRDGPDDIRSLTGRLVLATEQRFEQIPQLDEVLDGISVQRLSTVQVKQVCRLLDMPEPVEEPALLQLAPRPPSNAIVALPALPTSKLEAATPVARPAPPPIPQSSETSPAVSGKTIGCVAVVTVLAALALVTAVVIVGIAAVISMREPPVADNPDLLNPVRDGLRPPRQLALTLREVEKLGVPLDQHRKRINCVAIGGDSHLLATGADDHLIKLWELATGKFVRTLDARAPVKGLAFHAKDSTWLVAANDAKTIKAWNLGGKRKTAERVYGNPISSVSVSPDGTWIATTEGKNVHLWKPENDFIKTLGQHKGFVEKTAFSPVRSNDEISLVSASDDKTVIVWDAKRQKLDRKLDLASPVWSVAFSPRDKWIMAGCQDGSLWRLDAKGIEKPVSMIEPGRRSGSVGSVTFSGDGVFVAAAHLDHTIRLWEVETGRRLQTLDNLPGPVTSVAISPDNRWLAAAVGLQQPKVWEITAVVGE